MNATLNAREETIARLSREGMLDHEIAELLRRAVTSQRLAEQACDRELTAREAKRDASNDRAILALVAAVEERTGDPRWAVEWGDPRGYVVKVVLPSGASNNWGGTAWGLPVR